MKSQSFIEANLQTTPNQKITIVNNQKQIVKIRYRKALPTQRIIKMKLIFVFEI